MTFGMGLTKDEASRDPSRATGRCASCGHSSWDHYTRTPANGQQYDHVCAQCLIERVSAHTARTHEPWHAFVEQTA